MAIRGLSTQGSLKFASSGSGVVLLLWAVAVAVSGRPLLESSVLVLLQVVVSFVALFILVNRSAYRTATSGPGLLQFVALHVLLYYGVANIIPALVPELRPEMVVSMTTYRIPSSPVTAYADATFSALLLLLGLACGCQLAEMLVPVRRRLRSKLDEPRFSWLPGYGLAMTSCVVLLGLVGAGTVLYGFQFASLLTSETVANFSIGDQLLFHGLFWFLPLAPLLGAAAYVQAGSVSTRRRALALLVLSTIIMLILLTAWRTRSTAMLAVALPLALLVYAGEISLRRIAIPGAILTVVVYVGITAVRLSSLPGLLAGGDWSVAPMSEVLSAIGTMQGERTIAERGLSDLSYRTAGLEPVAALLDAQQRHEIDPKWGVVIVSGMLQALPAGLRPEFEIPERVKTAPSLWGVFEPGDWVTTLLAEVVLDFGPVWLVLPAVVAGAFLAGIERVLLRLGRHSLFEGLLIVRMAYLVYFIAFGDSIASATLQFFKATIGYSVLLVLFGVFASVRLNQVPAHRGLRNIGGSVVKS